MGSQRNLAETEVASRLFPLRCMRAGQVCSALVGLFGGVGGRSLTGGFSAGGDAIRVTDLDSFRCYCAAAVLHAILGTRAAHQLTSGLPLTPAAPGPTVIQQGGCGGEEGEGLLIARHLFKSNASLGPHGNRPGACGLASGGIFPHVGAHVKSH